MADQTVTVRLRLDAGQYEGQLNRSAGATRGFATEAERSMAKAESSVRRHSTAIAGTLGKAFLAGTAGAGALTVSLAKVGVGYNSLEATARKAMSTLLGSGQAATQMMDELFAFTQESPFGRETFIRATQQLVGFGMEAEKIIPALSAIQDAMAAVGRGDQDIAEVVNVLAKITSTGKITAQNLNELGIRGVDAARLIGEQMGKTGDQIRSDITNGALDAGTAVDMLVAGMTARFGGAAADLKGLWDGALQSISARWRNLGSDLAEPFVSKQGGGAAVDWANQLADMLTSLRGSVVPALVPRLEKAADSASALADRVQAFVDGLDADQVDRFLVRAGQLAPMLGGIAGGLTAAGSAALPFVRGINPIVGILTGMASASPEVRAALVDLGEALLQLGAAAGPGVAALGDTLTAALAAAAPVIQVVAAGLEIVADVLDRIPGPVLGVVGAFVALRAVMQTTAAIRLTSLVQAGGALDGLRLHAMYAGDAMRSGAGAMGMMRTAGSHLAGMVGSINPVILGVGALAIGLGDASQRAQRTAADVKAFADAMRAADDALEGTRNRVKDLVTEQRWLLEMLDDTGTSLEAFSLALAGSDDDWADMTNGIRDFLYEAGRHSDWMALEMMLRNLRSEAEKGTADFEAWARVAGESADAADDVADSAAKASPEVEGLADSMNISAEAAERALDAFKELQDAYRAAVDPVFALADAIDDHKKAQSDLDEVLKDSKSTADDIAAAHRDVGRSAMDVKQAAEDLALAVQTGNVSIDEAVGIFAALHEQGLITEGTFHDLTAQIADTVAQADEWEGERIATFLAETAGAEAKINELINRSYTARIHLQIANPHVRVAGPQLGRASGGIVPRYLAGGGPLMPFVPRGTDTVPAMLTPGEFVVRKQAVDRLGLPFLERINRFAHGGHVQGPQYLARGGTVGQAPVGWDLHQAQREVGLISDHTWRNLLIQRLNTFRAFSDEWMDAHRRLKQFEDEQDRLRQERLDRAQRLNDQMRRVADDRISGLWAAIDARESTVDLQGQIDQAKDRRLTIAGQISRVEGRLTAAQHAGDFYEVIRAQGELARLRDEDQSQLDRIRQASRKLMETQSEMVTKGKAGVDQFRELGRQAGLTAKEIQQLVVAYQDLAKVGTTAGLKAQIRAEFARQGRSLTAGDTRGETGEQRVNRIARELQSGQRDWDDLVASIARLPRRAHGGDVWPSGAFLVGEDGPEIFSPDRPGTIVPRQMSAGYATAGQAMSSLAPTGMEQMAAAIQSMSTAGGGEPLVVRVLMTPAPGANRHLVAFLRESVQVEGGGDVQAYLGGVG